MALPANCEQLLNEHRGGKTFMGFEEEKALFWEALHHWYNKSFYHWNSDTYWPSSFSEPTISLVCWCHGGLTYWTGVQSMGNLGLLSASVKINRWSYWLQCIVAFVTAIRECHNCLGSVSLESECSWPLRHIFSALLLLALHVCFATGPHSWFALSHDRFMMKTIWTNTLSYWGWLAIHWIFKWFSQSQGLRIT